jgi:hypothetical protein
MGFVDKVAFENAKAIFLNQVGHATIIGWDNQTLSLI